MRSGEHPPQLCGIGLGIESLDVAATLLLSVACIGDHAHGQRVVDVEAIPTGLQLIEVPHISVFAVGGIAVFGRLLGSTGILAALVHDVTDLHLQLEGEVGLPELHYAFKPEPVFLRTGFQTAILSQQSHGLAVALAWRVGIGVDKVVVIRFYEEPPQLLLHGVGVTVFVGEEFGRELVQAHQVDHLVEMIGLTVGSSIGQGGLALARGFDGAPGQVDIIGHLVLPESEPVGGVDVRHRRLRGPLAHSTVLLKGVAIVVGGPFVQRSRVGQLHTALFASAGHGLVERGVAHAEEVLVNQERGIVFVGHAHTVFIFLIGVARELVVDEHPVLVVVFEFETIENLVGGHDVEVVALGGDGHLSVVVLGNVYFLKDGNERRIAHGVVGVVGQERVGAVGAHTDSSALKPHAQNGMHGVDLFVSFHVALDGGGRGFDQFLEEVVHLLVAATGQQHGGADKGREREGVYQFHCC